MTVNKVSAAGASVALGEDPPAPPERVSAVGSSVALAEPLPAPPQRVVAIGASVAVALSVEMLSDIAALEVSTASTGIDAYVGHIDLVVASEPVAVPVEVQEVRLLAIEEYGQPGDQLLHEVALTVAEEVSFPINAAISANRTTGYDDAIFVFTDTSDQYTPVRTWDFGPDAVASSTTDTTVEVYWTTTGTKTVSLDVSYMGNQDSTSIQVEVLPMPAPTTTGLSIGWTGKTEQAYAPLRTVDVPETVDPTADLLIFGQTGTGNAVPKWVTEIHRDNIAGDSGTKDVFIGVVGAYQYQGLTLDAGTTSGCMVIMEVRNAVSYGAVAEVEGANAAAAPSLVLDTSALTGTDFFLFAHSWGQTINIGASAWDNDPVLASGQTPTYVLHANVNHSVGGLAYGITQAWSLFDGTFGDSVSLDHHISNGNYGWGILAMEVEAAPTATGPAISVWTGGAEVPATATVWSGGAEVPASAEIAGG